MAKMRTLESRGTNLYWDFSNRNHMIVDPMSKAAERCFCLQRRTSATAEKKQTCCSGIQSSKGITLTENRNSRHYILHRTTKTLEKKNYSCSTWHQKTVIIRQLRSLTLSSTKKLVDRFLSIKETSWCRHISVWRSWWWGWKLWHIVHCTIYSTSRYIWHICVFWHGALHLTREQDETLQRDLDSKEPGICQHDKHNKSEIEWHNASKGWNNPVSQYHSYDETAQPLFFHQ